MKAVNKHTKLFLHEKFGYDFTKAMTGFVSENMPFSLEVVFNFRSCLMQLEKSSACKLIKEALADFVSHYLIAKKGLYSY